MNTLKKVTGTWRGTYTYDAVELVPVPFMLTPKQGWFRRFTAAAEHVQRNISAIDHNGQSGILAQVVYEVGVDLSPQADSNHPCTLRGPYFAFAYNFGWRSWERKIDGSDYTNEWEEKPNVVV